MANTKAAKKDILINKRNRKRNLAKRAEVKYLLKSINLLASGNATEKELIEKLNTVYRTLDRIPSSTMTEGRASRLKSRAAKIIKAKLAEISA